ncbi:hypothetical protein ACFVT5_09005 [Streptomyces sp. NPDC058001]|uniref:hypothetical protein n=1 Tax=Streptomyces sp. NPDC058001 TaxID=3346300 RepID=UPI0036E055D9
MSRQRTLLFLSQLFDAFDDARGAAWARQAQDFTHLTDTFNDSIRRAAEGVPASERARIQSELPWVRDGVMERLADGE